MERVVSFIVREKDIFPELLVVEHPLHGFMLPEGKVEAGENARRAALRVASRHSDLGNFSSIEEITRTESSTHRFYKVWRNEPPGALGYWRHSLLGVKVRVKWMRLDGHIRLGGEAQTWLAEYEHRLLE